MGSKIQTYFPDSFPILEFIGFIVTWTFSLGILLPPPYYWDEKCENTSDKGEDLSLLVKTYFEKEKLAVQIHVLLRALPTPRYVAGDYSCIR